VNKLEQITYWPERAAHAKYCARKLAKNCDVTLRTLERYFKKKKGKCPQVWLDEERLERAPQVLQVERSVKLTAAVLGYKSEFHFSRVFKNRYGYPPSGLLGRIPLSDGLCLYEI